MISSMPKAIRLQVSALLTKAITRSEPLHWLAVRLTGPLILHVHGLPTVWVTDGLSHTVRLYAEDADHGQTYPMVKLTDPISLTVTNSVPEIVGPCPRSQYSAALEELFTHDFDATDPNVGDTQDWFRIGL